MLAVLICSTPSRHLCRLRPTRGLPLLPVVTPTSCLPCLFPQFFFSFLQHALPRFSPSCLFLFPPPAATPPLHTSRELMLAQLWQGQATQQRDSHLPDLDSYISIQCLHISFLQRTPWHPCQSDPTGDPTSRLTSSFICVSSTLQAHAPTISHGYPSPTLGCATIGRCKH